MKKLLAILIAAVMIVSVMTVVIIAYVQPGDDGEITVAYASEGSITLDGVINENEWTAKKIVLDGNNLVGWTAPNEFSGPIDCYFEWDESGFYIAASITDPQIEEGSGTIFQIALNPGGLIGVNYPGLFFSIGRTTDNNLTLRKHNWKSSADDGTNIDITGKYMILKEGENVTGWSLECILPWDIIASADRTADLSEGVESLAAFDPSAEGSYCDATIAYVQSVAGVVSTGRTTTNGIVGWNVDSYDIKFVFEAEKTEEATSESESETDESVSEPEESVSESEESGAVTEPEGSESATEPEESVTEPEESGSETEPEESETEPEETKELPSDISEKADVNGDGGVDNKDVVFLFRYASASNHTAEEDVKYDVNSDGEVNNKDVVELFRYISTLAS